MDKEELAQELGRPGAQQLLSGSMVRISIEPRWARFYDFGAGRLPTFLANLVNDG